MKKARQEGLARFSFGRWAGLQNRVFPGIQAKIRAFFLFKLNTGNSGDGLKIAQFLREGKKKVHFIAKKVLHLLHMCSRITLFPEGREQKIKLNTRKAKNHEPKSTQSSLCIYQKRSLS